MSGEPLSPAIVVELSNASGIRVSAADSVEATVVRRAGKLRGRTSVDLAGGVARFSDLVIDGLGIGIPGVLPGFSIHAELRLLSEAGIEAFAILASGTRDAGAFLTAHMGAPRSGAVAVGARADLVLLDHDPRADLETLRDPVRVMVSGAWYPRDWLHAELEALRGR